MSFINKTPSNIKAAYSFLNELERAFDYGTGRYSKLTVRNAYQLLQFAILHRDYMEDVTYTDLNIERKLINEFRAILFRDWIPLKIREMYYVRCSIQNTKKFRG